MKKRYLGLLIIIGIGFGVTTFINKKTYLSEDDAIGVYINNELSSDIPSKDSALFQKAVCDDENVSATWDSESWGLLLKNLTKKTKCNLYFYSGETVFNFDYTGAEQTFIAPVSGTYKLETWGAQGGNDTYWGGQGGVGGYSKGYINLARIEEIYINIGGSGQYGGYNGGNELNDKRGASGGGATHISKTSGLLSSLVEQISKILIVSGGGGGAERQLGGSGGGYIGNTGKKLVDGFNYFSTGGTQNRGGTGIQSDSNLAIYDVNGKFGQGGMGNSDTDSGPDGGGGFFGGGAATWAGGAGGGSGYIGNPLLTNKVMYCYNCEESSEESTKTVSTTCSEETPTENCAKKGNGYARITLVSIDE